MLKTDTLIIHAGNFLITAVSMPSAWVAASTKIVVPWSRFPAAGGLTLVAVASVLNAMIRPVVWNVQMRERLIEGPASELLKTEGAVSSVVDIPGGMLRERGMVLCGLEYRGEGTGHVHGASLWFEAKRRYGVGSQTATVTGG